VAALKGLLALARQAAAKMQLEDEEVDVAAEWAKIELAVERGEKVAAEAQLCLSISSPKTKNPRPVREPPPPPKSPVPADFSKGQSRPLAPRDVRRCVVQGRVAGLLVAAMELPVANRQATEDCATELSKRGIEPPGGWQLQLPMRLDAFYVIAVRAMGLKVEKGEDPDACRRALRVAGLPVDTLLPDRGPADQPAPLLLESEVREFLLTGYAAPLASSERAQPD
jgi:hypothetical protein